jgi:lipopolysaccharide biosynthesis regulator YciM
MEIELWWLLAVPVFFGLGWAAARVDIRHLLSESRALPGSYFKGLNFLLNEQPDKAIDAFIEVVKLDPETIELHFALGNLFRRRGEIERAIRMHTNLVNRPDLNDEQRLHALFELGQDYLKAGLLDRAEESLTRLEGTSYAGRAQTFLLEIYELEKDWDKAIRTAERVERETGESRQKEIAEFNCERAAASLARSQADEARTFVEAALKANRKAVRANMILGDVETHARNHAAAIDAWLRIETQDPRFLSQVAARLMEAHRALGKATEGAQLLRGLLAHYPSADLLEIAFQVTLEVDGADNAYAVVREELRKHPTLAGLDKLLEAQLLAAPPERAGDLSLIKSLIHAHTERIKRYACENCGFKAKQFFWRCPGCGGWETYSPTRAEELNGSL